MQKEIKVSFYADVEEKKMDDVLRAFNKCGAYIIGSEFPELMDVGCFDVEVMRKKEAN